MLGFEPLGSIPLGGLNQQGAIQEFITRCYLLGSKIVSMLILGGVLIRVGFSGSHIQPVVYTSVDSSEIILEGSISRIVNLNGDTKC